MKNRLFHIFLILGLLSCATNEDKNYERVDVEKYYRPSGMIRYFLPEVPGWKNTSFEANCHRKTGIRYLHIENLMESFALDYESALQMQYLFNVSYQNSIVKKNGTVPNLKEEEALFFEALDKIKAGQRVFKKPTFKNVNLIWVDDLLENNSALLRKFMMSEEAMRGRPLLLSMCYSRSDLIKKLRQRNISFEGSRFISFEMFSYFTSNGDRGAREVLDLSYFFTAHQTVNFYYLKNKPRNILGNFRYKKIK